MEEQKTPEAPPAAPAKGKGMWIGIVVVVIVIVILLAAVFGGLFQPPTTKDTELELGTVLTLTGTSGLEVFGPKNQRGAMLAVAEINAAGGVLGHNITVINEDDNGVDATAQARAQKLVGDGVDAILGAVGSGKCAAVLTVTKPNQIVQVSASCTSPIFSNHTYTGDWFFRTAPSDALQGVVAANYAYTNRSLRTMGVVGNNNPYGSGLANVFATEFESLGGTANVAIFAEAQGSYSSELGALISGTAGIEAIYMANYPTDGLQVMRDWAANPAWSAIQWIFSEGVLDQGGFIDPLYASGINASAFEGSAPGAYLGIVGPLYSSFETRYKAAYANQDPGLFTANAYDAVYLIAAAAERAGEATPAGIKANMRAVSGPPGSAFSGGQWAAMKAAIDAGTDVNYEGASGAVNLDEFGDPLSGYAIWGVNAGTQLIETREFFDEATVISMVQGAPPQPAPGTRSADWQASVRRE
jgi:ABC-type branched-subunit amino acid transport system substrate-binding protein